VDEVGFERGYGCTLASEADESTKVFRQPGPRYEKKPPPAECDGIHSWSSEWSQSNKGFILAQLLPGLADECEKLFLAVSEDPRLNGHP
jgi:hypothetical protein